MMKRHLYSYYYLYFYYYIYFYYIVPTVPRYLGTVPTCTYFLASIMYSRYSPSTTSTSLDAKHSHGGDSRKPSSSGEKKDRNSKNSKIPIRKVIILYLVVL